MKALKSSAIAAFLILLSISFLHAQENKGDTVLPVNKQVNSDNTGGAGDNKGNGESGKVVQTEKGSVSDSGESKKPTADTNKTEQKKSVKSARVVLSKKSVAAVVETDKETVTAPKIDGDLLLIEEGNFKYKRIPDIKLPEIKSEESLAVVQNNNTVKTEQKQNTGSRFSKGAVDVIIKIGVLLLVLVIFILYRSRMSGPGRKSSKKRNVLNSYRK